MAVALPMDSILHDLLFTGKHYFLFLGDLVCGQFRWSANAVETLHLPGTETGDEVWDEMLLPEEAAALRSAMAQVATGRLTQFEDELSLRVAGGIIPARVQLWSMDEARQPGHCAGMITNLSQEDALAGASCLGTPSDLRNELAVHIERKAPCGLLLLSPDDFKRISERHGHGFGDLVLYALGEQLSTLLPPGAALYRVEADCFGMLLPDGTPETAMAQFARFQELTIQPLIVKGATVPICLSGAVCFSPKDGEEIDALLSCARFALGLARTNGGNQLVVYTRELSEKTKREMLLLEKLRECVGRDFAGFSLNYQPLILAENNALYGCEVLLRFAHRAIPEGTSPYEFIPLLERSGLMPKVGAWVIRQALHQCAQWVEHMPHFQMSINVTYEQLRDPEFRGYVMDCLGREKISPNLLTLELTESNYITDTEAIGQAFDFFRSQGIKMAFDDFGMGYASLDIFRVLSADELKIDRSFLNRMTYDVTDQKIVAHLINLCNSINMSVCVEGVETKEVLDIVRQLKPLLLQGYYYNKPMTALAFAQYYFAENDVVIQPEPPTCEDSLVYSALRPAQPMSGQELVDSAHAGIFQVGIDEQFTFLTCNEGYRKMMGYTAREVEAKFKNHALAFVHPDDMAFVDKEIRRQLGRGDTIASEFRIVRADGSPLWVLGSGSVARGKDGSSSLSVVILDNDKAKKRALKLEQEHSRYQRMLTNLPSGVKCVRLDADFTIEYISPAFISLLGYSKDEFAAKFDGKYNDLIYEEDRDDMFRDISEQSKTSDIVTLRYRTPCKDGRLIWLETVTRICPPEEDGIQRGYSSVVDVTDSIMAEEKSQARSLATRYQAAATQWGDVLFECDFRTGSITYSSNFNAVFGRLPSPDTSALVEMVHPNDRTLVRQTMQALQSGKRPPPVEVRALFGDSTYRWCAVYFNDADMVDGVALSAVGKVQDIHQERLERERLVIQAQTDPLTGLLNKSTLEERIRRALSMDKALASGVLFMVDVDNFKRINDLLGHPGGDHLLRDVAGRLHGLFHSRAILGRAGGDEFMAFMHIDEDTPTAKEQCERMMTAMSFPFYYGDEVLDVSFSVGVALYPDDGRHFYELFRRADGALYRAKDLGKNRYCFSR